MTLKTAAGLAGDRGLSPGEFPAFEEGAEREHGEVSCVFEELSGNLDSSRVPDALCRLCEAIRKCGCIATAAEFEALACPSENHFSSPGVSQRCMYAQSVCSVRFHVS